MSELIRDNMEWLLEPNNIELIGRYSSILANLEDLIPVKNKKVMPPVFIIGAPRSGTTLLHQVMSKYLDVGYINNFIARFWKAPLIGTYLSQKIYKIKPDHDFKSFLGRTKGLGGVHEFGYYWLRFFDGSHSDYADSISQENASILQREVHGMSSIFDRRMVFKNLTCGLRIAPLCKTFPGAVFIVSKRNKVENAISILKGRRIYKSSEAAWWSLVPRQIDDYKKLDIESQIKAQIISTYEDINRQIKQTKAKLITIEYEQMCSDPKAVIKMLSRELDVNITECPISVFSPTTHLPTEDPLENRIIDILS